MNKDLAKRSLSLFLVIVIAGGILYFMFRSVARDWPIIASYPWEVSWLSMIASVLFAIISMLLAIKAAHTLCSVLGGSIPFVRFLYIFSIVQLGRYLPGRIWHLVSFTIFLEREGMKRSVSIIFPVLLQGIMVAVLWVTGALMGHQLVLSTLAPRDVWLAALCTSMILLVLLALPSLLRKAGRILRYKFQGIAGIYLPRRGYLSTLGLLTLSGVALAAAFFLFVSSLMEVTLADAPTIGGVFLMSYVIGWVVFIVPGGLGIREGTLAFLLAVAVSSAVSTVVALAARVWLTGAECLLLLGVWIWARIVKGVQLSLINVGSDSDGSAI